MSVVGVSGACMHVCGGYGCVQRFPSNVTASKQAITEVDILISFTHIMFQSQSGHPSNDERL